MKDLCGVQTILHRNAATSVKATTAPAPASAAVAFSVVFHWIAVDGPDTANTWPNMLK